MGCSDGGAIQTNQAIYYPVYNPVYTPVVQNNPYNPNYQTNNYNTNTNQVIQKKAPKEEDEYYFGVKLLPDKNIPNYFSCETDDFILDNYKNVFGFDLREPHIQTITKIYSDLREDDNEEECNGKIHQIYITLDSKFNEIMIIEIERKLSIVYTKHLKLTRIKKDCSLQKVKPILEKYNSEFQIDSSQWYRENKTTNIYVKAEISTDGNINSFEIHYNKETSEMEVIRKNTENNFSESSGKVVANRGELFAKYNELKSDFIIDHEPEAATLPELLNNNLDNEDQKSDDSVKTEEKIIEGSGPGVVITNNININGQKFKQRIIKKGDPVRSRGRATRRRGSSNGSYHNNSNNASRNSNDSKRSYDLKDNYGKYAGRVDRNGYIKDYFGRDLGKFDSDGVVRGDFGAERAKIEDGVIKDRNGNKKLQYDDGVVKDADGNKVGEIRDGVVKDASGNVIGEANGLDEGQAAYLHFFKDD